MWYTTHLPQYNGRLETKYNIYSKLFNVQLYNIDKIHRFEDTMKHQLDEMYWSTKFLITKNWVNIETYLKCKINYKELNV